MVLLKSLLLIVQVKELIMNNGFPIERIKEITEQTNDFRLLERIPLTKEKAAFPIELNPVVGDEQLMVLLDTETTGLSYEIDAIIELGMVKVLYSPSKNTITSIIEVLSVYEDPGKPIPEFVVGLTGITDEKVAGQKIDDDLVAKWLADSPLVVAHNAKFDRPFFERRFPNLKHLSWACSANGIDWAELGFSSKKLEFLLLQLGWFYEGHRASIDCLAMAWLFYRLPEALTDLLKQAKTRTVFVRAFGAPFDVKDYLKERGYRWHNGNQGANKHWWCEIAESDLPEEQEFLNSIYHHGAEHAHYDYQDASVRFKAM